MTIKVRLILSYTAMLVVPVILLAATGWILRSYYAETTGLPHVRYDHDIKHPYKIIDQIAFLRELNFRLLETTDRFKKRNIWKELEEDFPLTPYGIVVRKDREILYASESLDKPSVIERLPPFRAFSHDLKERNLWRVIRSPFQWDFYFQDGSPGSVFFFINPLRFDSAFPHGILLLLITIIILVATNGVLTFLVSRSILRPLMTLKGAAERIKDGDLDSKLSCSRGDEFGEVVTAFEEMRMRLKESMETQLQYEENRKELISNISHDLRTPITAIKGYVEGIRDGIADSPEKKQRYLNTIYSKAVLMDHLIDDLFFYSRLDLKRVPFDFNRLELNSFIQETLDELASDYDNLSLEFASRGCGEINVTADRMHLKRVFSNLIENAAKYGEREQILVEVALKSSNDFVTVELTDNGPGIDSEDLPHIFDRFFRADRSRNSRTGGSGLGLAIAHQIIEAHGGRIWAESTDGGTRVSFTLRRADS
jgi:signal transduction histidine kinase